jgi:exosortase family protein XrtM
MVAHGQVFFVFDRQDLDMVDRLVLRQNLGLLFQQYRPEILFTFWVLVLFAVLSYAYWLLQDTHVENFILGFMTAKPVAVILNLLAPGDRVVLDGTSLSSPHATFNVIRGCEAMGGMLLMISAICAANLPFTCKLRGLFYGVAFIYLLNVFRIVGLYYTMRYYSSIFNFVHCFVGQSFIIFLGCGFFALWLFRNTEKHDSELVR